MKETKYEKGCKKTMRCRKISTWRTIRRSKVQQASFTRRPLRTAFVFALPDMQARSRLSLQTVHATLHSRACTEKTLVGSGQTEARPRQDVLCSGKEHHTMGNASQRLPSLRYGQGRRRRRREPDLSYCSQNLLLAI